MLGDCCLVLESRRSPRQERTLYRYRFSVRTEGRWEGVPTGLGLGCCHNSPAGRNCAVAVPVTVVLVEAGPNNLGEGNLGCSSEEGSWAVVSCCGGFRRS